MTAPEPTEILDVTGLNCPLPVVKTKQAVDGLAADDVLEVRATDPGSVSDIAGWAEGTDGVELIEQVEADGGGDPLFTHFVKVTA